VDKHIDNSLRIPRAPNLVILKSIIIKLHNHDILENVQKNHGFNKKSFFVEYIKLLELLGWVQLKKDNLVITNKGEQIKLDLTLNSNSRQQNMNIIKPELLNFYPIQKFLREIFNFKKGYGEETNRCYHMNEIYEKYNNYRKISKIVSNREARLIVNWLSQINILESLPSFNPNDSDIKLCYHIIGYDISYLEFQKIIASPNLFNRIQNLYKKRSEWIEIPILRKCVCIQHNISKKQFDDNLIKFMEKNPHFFNLSKSTIMRTEVVNEGLKYEESHYFYIRINKG
jgi:hypothetical protein